THGSPNEAGILGVVSLIVWSLIMVVVLKYLTFVLKVDNRGEGGILALLALSEPQRHAGKMRRTLLLTGLVGSALLFADGIITPAISVLSAVEGLEVATPRATEMISPIAVGILIGLFMVQRGGTGALGAFFGPAVLLWFLTIAAVGVPWIISNPHILAALSPTYALAYLARGGHSYFVLGAVVLCVTGGEALYADLGHFGRGPIRWAWYTVVFPALLLSYFGQGAYLLSMQGRPVGNPFYEMVPQSLILPMVGIATVATIVASQALITGVFAMVHQAVQLGYLPRVTVVHTSKDMEGRIYIPQANFLLMVLCITLVLTFRSSSALASAYGIAVTGTMSLTTVLFFAVKVRTWGVARAGIVSLIFLVIDLAFLIANVPKIGSGGWVPLAVASIIVAVMTSWQRGTEVVRDRLKLLEVPLTTFLKQLSARNIARVPGAAVFLTREAYGAPPMLVHYVDHSLALQEHCLLLTVQIDHEPRIAEPERITIEDIGHGFFRIRARYGFMESPDLGRVLTECECQGVPINVEGSTIFVGHSTVITTGSAAMMRWRKNLFEMLNRNARPASTHYHLPSSRVMEIGVRIEI
ncbi:MAG TPA: KUP/HAK/KT family potassium transporter, partial [Polyangiales bacterium]|nr:KUP/HAK/KT family potassium transporter [Polyangiales bacterium]